MKNFVQNGNNIDVSAPYVLKGGDGFQVGAGLFGVSASDAAQDTPAVMVRRGVYSLKKKAADVMAVGAVLYWDNALKELTITAGANLRAGLCVIAAGAGTTAVSISIND